MKNNYITQGVCLLTMALFAGSAWAQKAGDVISGTISDEIDVLAGAHVIEINKDDRVMASAITDINGNFSFAIRNPQDRLKITYLGCETIIVPIKGFSYKLMLKQASTQLGEVVIQDRRRTQTSGLDIPVNEVSGAMQAIKASDIENLATVTSIDEALQGRISGLDIVFSSGNLGAGTSMRLRGVSTINGNAEPLVVVDGNVFESDYKKDFDFNNATEDKLSELLQINPEDIEEVSVLKDASATAIWGSQGANGVIEIKTKRGSRGATRVNYSYRANVTYQPEGMKLLRGGEYTMFLKESYFNRNFSDDAAAIKEIQYLHSDADFADWRQFNNDTDWPDAVKQVGLEQKHALNVTGGGEKANFRFSFGWDHQTGSIIEQKLDRFTQRTALDYFLSRRIKVTTNFNFTYTNNHQNNCDPLNTNYNKVDLIGLAYKKMPNLAIYEEIEDGVPTGEFYHVSSTMSEEFKDDQRTYVNPVALAEEAHKLEKTFNIQPEFILRYDLLSTDGESHRLTYNGKVNFSIFNKHNSSFFPSTLVNGSWNNKNRNKAENSSNKSFAITTQHTLTFAPVFANPDHNLMALARFQLTKGTSHSQNNGIYNMPYGTITSSSGVGLIDENFGTGASEWRNVYLTGQVHYSYKERYVFDFTIRRDGSTKFGRNSRWGNFPGVSLRWNISDESWMDWSDGWLSMLSIRPGWGIVGNQPYLEGLFYAKYGAVTNYMGQGAIAPSNIALNTLRWEEKEQYNLGTNLGFLDNRITADINLYKSMTTSLMMEKYPLPTSSGYDNLPNKNTGRMDNVGWEFNINTSRLIKWGKDWMLDLNVNFANNQNKLIEMDESVLDKLNGEFDFKNGSYLTHVWPDAPFGAIYGFRYKGVYQYSNYAEVETPGICGPNAPVARNAEGEPILDELGKTKPMYFAFGTGSEYEFKGGDAIYEDVNHDGNINELDIVYLGSSLPKVTGGFGFKLSWGRLSWSSQFNFRYGNKIINGARMNAESMYGNNNQSRAVNWRWRVEGDETQIPRALHNAGYNWLGSDRFVEEGSFLRLNYSSINYTLSSELTKKLHLSRISVFLQGNNIFCLTKYSGADPEVNYGSYGIVVDNAQTPRSKSFSAGAQIQF